MTDAVSDAALKDTLTKRFGPIEKVDFHRQKACAFLEFTQLDAARRAIAASLPVSQGGEGGIRIDGAEGNARIYVETRKERGERPPPRGPPTSYRPTTSARGSAQEVQRLLQLRASTAKALP